MWDPRENTRGFTKEEEELWQAAKDWYQRDEIVRMRDARRLRERQEQLKQQWDNTEEGRAFQKLSESFSACKQLVEENPEAPSQAAQLGGEKYDVYAKLRENLDRANRAPRCCFLKSSGELCKAPKIKGQ